MIYILDEDDNRLLAELMKPESYVREYSYVCKECKRHQSVVAMSPRGNIRTLRQISRMNRGQMILYVQAVWRCGFCAGKCLAIRKDVMSKEALREVEITYENTMGADGKYGK